jgi:nucleobase:cation symporter-1, NCS1 family
MITHLTTLTGPLQFVELWFLINLNISTYQTGSSLIATGLNYWQAIIVILIGNALASTFAVVNSVSGAASHLGFPIVSRSVWGERPCDISECK